MNDEQKKYDEDAWDNRELGASDEHTREAPAEMNKAVDDSLDLQLISLRLQKDLIEKLKIIAKEEGIGYQPLMRQVLTRFVRESNISAPLKRAR